MYKRDFDTRLAQGTIPRAVLLYGESAFWVGYYGELVLKRLELAPEEKSSFYFGEYEANAVRGILAQASLFGDRSVVRLKLDKRPGKKEIDSFIAALEKNPNAFLVVEFYRAENRGAGEYSQDCKALAASFRGKEAVEVRFFAPTQGEALGVLRNRAKELGLEVQERWLLALLSMQNGDLGLAYNELEKFTLLGKNPDMKDLERLSFGLGSVSVEELCVALLQRQEAISLACALLEEGVDEMALVGEMERFFYQLFLFYAHIRVYGGVDSAEILGYKLPKALEETRSSMAIRLKEGQFFKILTILQEWRVQIMQGRGRENGLFSALIKIQAIL